MEKIMAVLTKDAAFGHTLTEYIINSHALKYKVLSFFDTADYMQFKDSNQVAVLLAEETIDIKQYETTEEKIFFLTEEKRTQENTIFKYQNFDITVRELNFKLCWAGGETVSEDHRFQIKTVMSGKGGSGVTTFALMLAAVSGKKQNTLFVSLDPFAELPADFEKNDGELSELIYALKVDRSEWYQKTDCCLRHGTDFDFVSGVLIFEDLNSFGKEEMRNFLAGVAGEGRYKTVIFDMGNFPPCSGVVLEKSETIYLIGEENTEAELQLKKLLGERVDAKLRKIELPLAEQFHGKRPLYSEFNGTELYRFAERLVADEKEKAKEITAELFERKNRTVREEEKAYNATGGLMPRRLGMKRSKSEKSR